MLADEGRGMDEKRTEARRESVRRENSAEVDKYLGSVLPDAQVRADERRDDEDRRREDEPGG